MRARLLDIQQNRRIRALNRQLTDILKHKETLLAQNAFLIGEINHRVQNSLQMVSSLMSLQAKGSNNSQLQTALEEARRRLIAVALVYRRLHSGDQIEAVDAAGHIEDLCAETVSFMGQDWQRHLSVDLAPIMVSMNVAVPLSLMLTELMINCNKYAYDGEAGPIEIRLSGDLTHIHLVVADRGRGSSSTIKGFGSHVIDGLIGAAWRQIDP